MYNFSSHLLADEKILYQGQPVPGKGGKGVGGLVFLICFALAIQIAMIWSVVTGTGDGANGINLSFIIIFLVATLFLGLGVYGLFYNLVLKKKQVANVIDSEEETTVRYVYGDSHSELTEELVKASFEFLINNDFDKYLKLPKISECSNLLQEIYDSVCESDASMCHVDDEDWMYWKDSFGFKDDDIEVLKKEIKKYGLDEVIGIGDSGYKIVGYGNLQSMFNDDRTIAKDYALDENNKLEILKTCKDYHILVNNLKYEFLEEIENKLQHYLNYISKNDNIDDYKKEYGNHDIVNWFEGTMDTKDFLRYNIKNKIDKNIEKGDSYEML